MTREDRRDSADEHRQIDFIQTQCKKIAEQYGLKLDLSDINSISRGKESRYFSHINGRLTFSNETKRNHYKDSKTIDGVTYFRNNDGKSVDIYYFCKYTKQKGGQQDYVPFEIEVTKNCIMKNTDNNTVVVFMLEGGFWTQNIINEAEFDNEKTFFIDTENFEQVITNILKIKNII